MQAVLTMLSAFGALLLSLAFGFFLFGQWSPAARDWLMPMDERARNIINKIGYVAAIVAGCWIVSFVATVRPPSH